MYQLLIWLVPTLEKFPKSQKFLLGDRIQATALDVLDHLIAANLGLERLRVLLRLRPTGRRVPRRLGIRYHVTVSNLGFITLKQGA